MIAKCVLFLAIILLVKGATSLECYECAALTMDQCNSWMKSVTCEAEQDHCFKYWGGHGNRILKLFFIILIYNLTNRFQKTIHLRKKDAE